MNPKSAAANYLQAYETSNPVAVVEHLAPDHVYYGPAGMSPLDYRERSAMSQAFFSAFANVRVEIADQVAEGDRVATRVIMRATHVGTYLGVPPTGRTVIMPFLDIARVRGMGGVRYGRDLATDFLIVFRPRGSRAPQSSGVVESGRPSRSAHADRSRAPRLAMAA